MPKSKIDTLIQNVATISNMMGLAPVVFGNMIQKQVVSLGIENEDIEQNQDIIIRQMKKQVLITKQINDAETLKTIKHFEKNINEVQLAYVQNQLITDEMEEALKHHLISNTEKIIQLFLPQKTSIHQDVLVFEENGGYAIFKREGKQIKKIITTNFTLQPIAQVDIQNRDFNTTLRKFIGISDIRGRTAEVVLRAEDFNTEDSFRKACQTQMEIIEPQVHDLKTHMRGLAHKLTRTDWETNGKKQIGTTVLGYERFSDDGNKYICTVNGDVFDSKGNIVEDVVFVDPKIKHIERSEKNLADVYGNMGYDSNTWDDTAKYLLENMMKINKKTDVMNIVGWFFAVAQEYNVRQITKQFPILHIAGPSGSGKSFTIQALKKYFGHADDSMTHYPTPPIFAQDMTLSYTIPAIFDEYGGSDKDQGWSDYTFNKIHEIIKHVYDKTTVEKAGRGEGGQGRFVYKMRNSLCSLGQIYIKDPSIANRAIQVSIDGSIKDTPEGDVAYKTANELMNRKDTNFIVGYMLYCMNLSDDWIQQTIRRYQHLNKSVLKKEKIEIDSRHVTNTVAVQLGLRLAKRLSKKLGVNVGYTYSDISNLMIENAKKYNRTFKETTDNALVAFLRDVLVHMRRHGNEKEEHPVYGFKGLVLADVGKSGSDAETYGPSKEKACVYGQKYVAMNLRNMISRINADLGLRGKDAHNFSAIQPYLESEFNKAKIKKGNGLVLAPNGYEYQKRVGGERMKAKFTIFSMDKLAEIDEYFEDNEFWEGSKLKPRLTSVTVHSGGKNTKKAKGSNPSASQPR